MPKETDKPSEGRGGGRLHAVFEWLTLRSALSAAERRGEARRRGRALVGLAGEAIHAADRLLDPPDMLARRPELALPLLRDAALWLACAASPDLESPSLETALERLDTSENGLQRPEPDVVAALLRHPTEIVERSEAERLAEARRVRRGVAAIQEPLARDYGELAALRRRRGRRLGGFLLGTAAVLTAAVAGIWTLARGEDLAQGKPWRTSSTYVVCQPERKLCGHMRTEIFFHTKDDDSPWLEIDLLRVEEVGAVEVKNRTDYGPDRAIPLLIELSTDGKKYWQVAEQATIFTEWTARFEPVSARYVRLRVPRKTFLHLERVSVRR